MEDTASILTLIGVIGLYFLLALLAWRVDHRQTAAIVVLNLFLGWTLIGWVVALVWASTKPAVLPRQP